MFQIVFSAQQFDYGLSDCGDEAGKPLVGEDGPWAEYQEPHQRHDTQGYPYPQCLDCGHSRRNGPQGYEPLRQQECDCRQQVKEQSEFCHR